MVCGKRLVPTDAVPWTAGPVSHVSLAHPFNHWKGLLRVMPKDNEPEIIPPEPTRAYNDKTLEPRDFLLAIMRDEHLPVSIRMDAAAKVAVYIHARLQQVTQDVKGGLHIRIEGGLPDLPGTNIIMPGMEAPSKGNGRLPDK